MSTLMRGVELKDGTVNVVKISIDADLAFGTHKITGLGDPSGAQDAATMAYVDSVAQGLTAKYTARAKSTGNVTVSNPGTAVFDGITLVSGNRLFLGSQTAGAQNGLYIFNGSGSALTRSTDMDAGTEIAEGAYVFIAEGTTYGATGWVQTTSGTITIGTTATTWVQFNAAGQVSATTSISVTGTALAVIVDPNAGLVIGASGVGIKLPAGSGLSVGSSGLQVDTGSTNGVIKYSNFIVNEVPSGTINGSNTTFTLANTPITGTLLLFFNGQLMKPSTDYTISGATITSSFPGGAAVSGDTLLATYLK